MSDEEALLRAICAQPDEETPKLAYADHLDEQGGEERAARAEFIRLHLRAGRMTYAHPDRIEVARRIGLLRRRWDEVWAGGLPAGFTAAAHERRGAPYCLVAPVSAVLAAGEDPRTAFTEQLVLTLDVSDAALGAALKLSLFRRLLVLRAEARKRRGTGLARALAAGSFPRLECLSLVGQGIGDAGVRALCAATGLARLRELNVCDNGITDVGARALQESHLCAGLTRLELVGNAISVELAERLRARLRPA